jgi:hypothetical protein
LYVSGTDEKLNQAYNSKCVSETRSFLGAETSKSSNTAKRGAEVGHLVHFSDARSSAKSVTTQENGSWDAVEVVVLRRIISPEIAENLVK